MKTSSRIAGGLNSKGEETVVITSFAGRTPEIHQISRFSIPDFSKKFKKSYKPHYLIGPYKPERKICGKSDSAFTCVCIGSEKPASLVHPYIIPRVSIKEIPAMETKKPSKVATSLTLSWKYMGCQSNDEDLGCLSTKIEIFLPPKEGRIRSAKAHRLRSPSTLPHRSTPNDLSARMAFE